MHHNNVSAGHGPAMVQTNERAAEIQKIMDLFDVIVESSKEGIRKPNPEIYRIAMSRLNVPAERIVFLDDLGIILSRHGSLG